MLSREELLAVWEHSPAAKKVPLALVEAALQPSPEEHIVAAIDRLQDVNPLFSLEPVFRFAASHPAYEDFFLILVKRFSHVLATMVANEKDPLALAAFHCAHYRSLQRYLAKEKNWHESGKPLEYELAHALAARGDLVALGLLMARTQNKKLFGALSSANDVPVHLAVNGGHWECVFAMLEFDLTLFAVEDYSDKTIAEKILLAGKLEELAKHFDKRHWITTTNRLGRNLAHCMVLHDKVDYFHYLVAMNPDLAFSCDNEENTCAHLVRSVAMLKAVLHHDKTSLLSTNKKKQTPATVAVTYPVVNRDLLIPMLLAEPYVLLVEKTEFTDNIESLVKKLGWDFNQVTEELTRRWQQNVTAKVDAKIATRGLGILRSLKTAAAGSKRMRDADVSSDDDSSSQDTKRATPTVSVTAVKATVFSGFAGGDREFQTALKPDYRR